MSNVGFIGKRHHHLKAPSASQEAPVQPRGEGGGRGGTCPCEGAHCVWVLFISCMEKGTFWTGSDLTHSHTVLMRSGQKLLSDVSRKSSDRSYMQHENRYIKLAAI